MVGLGSSTINSISQLIKNTLTIYFKQRDTHIIEDHLPIRIIANSFMTWIYGCSYLLGKELDSSFSNQPGVKTCDPNLKISQWLRGLFIISVPKLQVSLELPEISFSKEHITSTVPIASKLKGVTAAVLSVIQDNW